ncbi:hypothetical protein H8S37_13030 [Mediterraneibacter sp. NSJ-55]|uniref:Uncharacterized protein n=1 Tax=Mediterraneibacter hominis TaxID=2763054 RepID=A0A923LJ74_9FIRM|nr:hypothetical protein [Mediterraneibacter hominis]MBC5689833.1 hypothetical protein [Mediterraneibacter hominis]
MNRIVKKSRLPVERKWFCCPYPDCRQNLMIYDNTARCSGVYIRCKKCGREVKVEI